MRTLSVMLAAAAIALVASQASAQLGSNNPTDSVLQSQRVKEKGGGGLGIFDVAVPSAGTVITPAGRVPRDQFGVVGPEPLMPSDLDALVFPGTPLSEKQQMVEGLFFFSNELDFVGTPRFTSPHGIGPMNNQPYCQGCHHNTGGAADPALLGPTCPNGSSCFAPIARGARSQPTNFEFTSFDPTTGGGHAPNEVDADIPANDPGTTVQGTAAFTLFGDFTLSLQDKATLNGANLPTIGFFDPLDGGAHPLTNGTTITSQAFGGQVQHNRPAQSPTPNPPGTETGFGTELCVPGPIPPVNFDTNLAASNKNQFRRSVGERAAPPYLGRGLIEAVPTADIVANTDPTAENGPSSLGNFLGLLGCTPSSPPGQGHGGPPGCISGKANSIPAAGSFVGGTPGRFGLRANGAEILQFVTGGLQGELSFTSLLNTKEAPFPMLFLGGTSATTESTQCLSAASTSPEVHLSTVFSIRALLRNIAPPEFGTALLTVLSNRLSPSPRTAGRLRSNAERSSSALIWWRLPTARSASA